VYCLVGIDEVLIKLKSYGVTSLLILFVSANLRSSRRKSGSRSGLRLVRNDSLKKVGGGDCLVVVSCFPVSGWLLDYYKKWMHLL
jgi:hypothetical protein